METETLPALKFAITRSSDPERVRSATAMLEGLLPVVGYCTPFRNVPAGPRFPRMTFAKPGFVGLPWREVVAPSRSGTPSAFTSATAIEFGTLTVGKL